MIIRLTQKLGEKIGVRPAKALSPDANPYADWTSHLFTVKRAQYIILTNTASLYSMLMFGRGITDDNLFLKLVLSHMREFVAADGNEFLYKRLIAPSAGFIQFSKTGDRRVTGSINDLIVQARQCLETGEVSPCDTAQRLNEVPMSLLQYRCPYEAFRSLTVVEAPVRQ